MNASIVTNSYEQDVGSVAGPFRVVKKVGRVKYQIEMPHRRKKKQIYHGNLLKK